MSTSAGRTPAGHYGQESPVGVDNERDDMATAAELAVQQIVEHVASLERRLADAERERDEAKRRSPTEDEINCIRGAINGLDASWHLTVAGLKRYLDRIAPAPPVEWTEPHPGIHVAACNGWSLCIRRDTLCPQFWNAVATDGQESHYAVDDDITDLDAAKSEAVKWARENVR